MITKHGSNPEKVGKLDALRKEVVAFRENLPEDNSVMNARMKELQGKAILLVKSLNT